MRLQIEQKLPVSVAVVVAALAVAAGKCEHFGQHSQVVAGELAGSKGVGNDDFELFMIHDD